MTYRHIVGTHMNPYLSGVARFNQQLSDRLGVDYRSLHEVQGITGGPVLLSVKLSDNTQDDIDAVWVACDVLHERGLAYDVFLHSFDGLAAEYELIDGCGAVFAGNAEIAHSLQDAATTVETLWCPALVEPEASVEGEGATFFSFGMSHKMQLDYYAALKRLLDECSLEHSILVSTAFHEKASFGEIDVIERRFEEIFGSRVHLLGFLSDAALNHFLGRANAFVAFFKNGVRANNTSVYAAMGKGCALLTNLDEYSPDWMAHGVNVLDIRQLTKADLAPQRLSAIGFAGRDAVTQHAGWGALIARLA